MRMKVMLIGMAMSILGAGSVACAGTAVAQANRGPRLEVKVNHVDLGAVKQGEVAEHVFELRNTGNEVLVIQKVQTS